MASNRINDGFVYNGDAGAALDALGVGAPSTDMDGNEVLRWAVSQPSLTASDDEYRARATVIGRHLTGRVDPFGRVFSGNRQEGLGAREYYDKMIGFVQTMDPDTLWTDEAREYRALKTDAERTEYAKKHWDKKWRDYGDDVYDALPDITGGEPLSRENMERLGEFLSDEDRVVLDEWWNRSDLQPSWDDVTKRPTEEASAPDGWNGQRDTLDSGIREAVRNWDRNYAEMGELRRKAVDIGQKYEGTLRDIGIREKYEKKLADENQWATYMRLKDGFTPEEARCIDLALAAGGKDGLANPAREAFMALSTDSQRKVAPLLKMNAWRRDTTLVGDAVRGFARVLGETVQDAASGASHYIERLCVNGAEYQENAERSALLRMAEEGRMKEWGLSGEAVVGAFSTIPYMAIASIPYAGTATMILSAGEQFEREAALSGGDVSGWDMQVAKAGMSVAYALVERLQAHNMFGEVSDFERRKLYADFFHHINRNIAAKLAGGIAVDTLHESFEEGLQNGIQEAFVALSVDGDMARAFTRGFVEDAVGTLGTMFVTALVGGAKHTQQYRNRPFTAEEAVSWTAELEAAARSTEGSPKGNEGLAEIGRALGFVSRDWRRAAAAAAEAGAGAAELRKAALMKYGLDEGQALQWDAMLTEIERNIGEDKAAVQAFYGTQNALTRSEIRQAGGMVETVDEATGARTLTFKDVFGTGTFSVELNAASGIDAEYAKTDEGVRSIVNALNDSRRKAPDGGVWTDENWRALPETDKQSILSEFRNPGLTTFKLATGETVDNRFLAALEGNMKIADNAESGDVLGVAAFHEQGHVAGRMLALAARNGDEKAKDLVGKLAEKFGTAKLDSEAFDEEVFGDRFRYYLVGRFDVQDGRLVRKAGALDVAAEDETLFGQFVDWVRSLFSRADEAVRTRTRYDEFFEQAVNGDLEGAVAADEAAAGERETSENPRSTPENVPGTGAEPSGIQKQAGTAYPDASAEIRGIDERASITAKRLNEFMRVLAKNRPDLDAGKIVAELEKFDTPKEQKIALHWVVRGGLLLPEDSYKVADALSVSEKAKVDPFQYKSPDELMLAHKEFRPTARPIDPAAVPELSDPRDEGDGIVSYLVQDDRQGQAAMRRIINTHWGEDANPWCLLHGDGRGNLSDGSNGEYDAWYYWQHYSALPKRVAFKDGKLLAFMATEGDYAVQSWRKAIQEGRDNADKLEKLGNRIRSGEPLPERDEILDELDVFLETTDVAGVLSDDAAELRDRISAWYVGDAKNPIVTEEDRELFDEALDAAILKLRDDADEAEYENLQNIPDEWWDRKDESHIDLDWARGADARASIRAGSRVTPDEDAAYMDAVNRGDMETAQRMVDEAANRAGYSRRMWHGAKKGKGFTVFKGWSYFTENKAYAERYTGGNPENMYGVFVKADHVMDTRTDKQAREDFEAARDEYGMSPIGVRGLPDWTDGYDIADYIEENNLPYDMVVLDEGGDLVNGESVYRGDSYIVRDSAQIKSADPVTYDDAGNVIPLSQRFNTAKEDIRYSIRGPSMSKMDAAVAFAARDAMTGRERSDEDYKRLLKGLGLESKMDVGTLKQLGRDTAREAWLAESGKVKEAVYRKREGHTKGGEARTTGNADVNRVASELARNAAEASGETDFDKDAVRFAAKTSPTLRTLAKFAETGRHVREAINQAYKFAENAGVKIGTEAQKAEEEMRRAEEAVKAEEKRVADEIKAETEKLDAEIDAEFERIEAVERSENRRKEEVDDLRSENRRIAEAGRAAVEAKEEQIRHEEEAKLRQIIADINEKHREKLVDLRADYQEKLRAYREKVAAKAAGEKAMRQMLATRMRLHSNAENVQDLDRVLGVPAVELLVQICETQFSGAKAPGQVRGSADADAATGESGKGGEATERGAETTATGPEVRVVGTVEEASQAEAEELHDKLVRVMAIMRDIREKQKAKAEEQARKRAEREEREEAEAKPIGNDEMDAEADEDEEGEEDSGGEANEDSEPEVIETVDAAADPEMVRAMLNALKTESLDLNTSKDFATYVLAFVMDSVQQSLNMDFDAVFRNTDPIVKVKFRKTLIDFLRATSDALLDPTDDAAAKLVERRIGDIKDDASVAQLWRGAAGILGVIQRRGIQQSRRRIMRDIDKYLKRLAGSGRKLDPLAPDLSRRMTARAVQDARWLRRVLKLSNGAVLKEQEKLNALIEERQADGGDETDVQIDRAMRRMRLLEQFGGLRYMMPAEIKVAQHYIEDRFNAECMDLARRVEERKARTGAVADALIAAADATREALGGFDAEDGKGMSARGRRLLDSLAGGSLRQRLQHLTGDDPAARRAVDEIVRMVFEGETQHRLLEQRFKREHDAILQFAAAAGGIDQRTLLRQLDENVPDDLSRALATPEQNRRLKWGQALQLLVSLEQTASYGNNIVLHHREGHADLIRAAMSDRPQFQALISKLRETYRDRRGMISEVMERVTGLPVLSPDPLFMPVRMKSAPREGLDMKVKSWTPWNAIFSPRVKNNLDFDTSADIMGVFDERSRETAKSVAFAETGLDLRSILGRKETQTAFIRARGAFFNTRLIEQVTDALNSGYTTPSNDLINVLRPLGTACTYASLSWNVVTMLKQMTSIPAWTAVLDGGYGELFRAMSSLDGESIREFMDAPGFRSRYGVEKGGWGTFAKIIGDAFRDPSRSYIQRFYDAGMTLVQFGDFVPSFLIGPGVYKARKAALMRQNPGMTEESAKNQALTDAWSLVEQCQQSDLQENLPDILRRQGVVAKQVMKFCNSPLMQVAHEVQSARMWADAARRAKAGEAGAHETADKWRARFVNQIVCNHIIMPAAMYAAELLVKAALGNEPPDKDEVMGRIVAQMLLGSWGKVFILGVILDKVTTGASVGAGKATGLYNYKPIAYMSSGGSPAGIQLVEQLVSDMGRLGSDIAYTDWESLRDDSVRMLARSARPVKYGTDLAYNYGGADRAKERAARRRAIRKEREKAAGE